MLRSDTRMGGHVLLNYGKQLARSFVVLAHSLALLAHYTTLFVGCVSRSVRCFVEVVRWTALLARFTVSTFESVHRHLYRWAGRRYNVAMETHPSSSTTE